MTEKAIDTLHAATVLLACLAVAAGIGLRETSRIRGPDSIPPLKTIPQRERPSFPSGPRKKVLVAVIDTGLDLSDVKLTQNLWSNSKEKLNGIDDDRNGFVDDLHGWDFVLGTSEITDTHGHGTHVTGLILEQAPDVEILPLTYYAASLDGDRAMAYSLQALQYAVDADVDIINYSGGGMAPSVRERKILELAQRKGILVVAAAGNEAANTDHRQFFPANYDLSNILSVGAVSQEGDPLKSSNYGSMSVHFAALGDRVVSSLPGGRRGEMTGTSQATARVTGLAARLLQQSQSEMSPELIIETLSSIAKYDHRLSGRTKLSSRLEDSALQTQVNSTVNLGDALEDLVGDLVRVTGARDPAFLGFR